MLFKNLHKILFFFSFFIYTIEAEDIYKVEVIIIKFNDVTVNEKFNNNLDFSPAAIKKLKENEIILLPEKFIDNALISSDLLDIEIETIENDNSSSDETEIKKFFETEYFPKTRKSIGVSEITNGREYYQNRIRYYTTLDLTADEVHEIGLKEVARINAEMKAIIDEVEFDGSFDEFIEFLRTDDQFYAETGKELLKEGRDITKRIDAQLPRFFKVLPRKPYGVAPVPSAIAPKYTAGRYKGASSPTEPGYFWINTYKLESRPMYALPALALHEAVPGHHLQISLNAELGDSIPPFRRGFYLSAYGEGWGLYAESLGEEMGIYETPYQKFGQLTYEQWRACRLVVDTGMHAKGWSREKAVAFLTKNTALSLHEINTEIDRYISWPGQALSYKIGELKIKELRKKAEEILGGAFDIREFHSMILSQGTVTLTLMEDLVDNYIKMTKNE